MDNEGSGDFGLEGRRKRTLFSAQPQEGKVVLKWSVVSLDFFDRFVIERSVDGEQYVAIMVILGKTFLEEEKEHTSIDMYPIAGRSYYRLKMVYLDGDVKLFHAEVNR